MPYCIYLRKSRADQEAELAGEGETLARHENRLLALAKSKKLTVTKIYREIVSGETIAGRPQMQQLLQDVEAGLWEGVIVVEVERLGRGNTLDQGIILNAFKYSNTKIITPNKTYDPTNEFDEEYFEFSQFMSRREFKTTRRRMENGRLDSVKEGKFVGSVTPYGYTKKKLEREKGFVLVIDPCEAEAVKMAYELYAYGEPQPDGTIKEMGRPSIAKKLDMMGYKNRKGGTWATSSVTRMLQNPVYVGKLFWGYRPNQKKTEEGRIHRYRPVVEDCTVYEGRHEPIVSEELWYTVQEKMKQNQTSPNFGTAKNPLAGLVRCSYCGKLMQRRPHEKRNYPTGLICTTHFCPQVYSELRLVEEKILEGLEQWVKTHEATWEDTAHDFVSPKIQILKNSLANAEKELSALEVQFENTFDLLEKGIYTPDIFAKRNEMIAGKISVTTNNINEIKEQLCKLENMKSQQAALIPKIKTLLDTYYSVPIREQNRMLKEVLEKVVYFKDINKRWRSSPDDFEITLYPKISSNF